MSSDVSRLCPFCDACGLTDEQSSRLKTDARALWAVRVLDRWAAKTGLEVYVYFKDAALTMGGGWHCQSRVFYRRSEGKLGTADAARIAAAEALVAEDPTLGGGP